jgi:tetratricopeptide (TPR) repeat protein
LKQLESSLSFYDEVIKLIDLNEYDFAIKSIKRNIDSLESQDEIALAYLNCAFLNDKLGDNLSAIDDFSKSIFFEARIDIIHQRSKDISYSGRSNSRYKNGDYQGAIDDKRQANKIRLLEIDQSLELNNNKIDYTNILLGTFVDIDLGPNYNTLVKSSKIRKSKYDLIADYKKVISDKRKEEVIRKLELLSESKYKIGDYKGSIKAIRRAEKYY